ncbi:MAG: hypothetical protein M3162_03775, partial [Thermoproteota archaeon]|nr:hypothetical protein [Thermoproteota archaeon]
MKARKTFSGGSFDICSIVFVFVFVFVFAPIPGSFNIFVTNVVVAETVLLESPYPKQFGIYDISFTNDQTNTSTQQFSDGMDASTSGNSPYSQDISG